MSAQEPPIKISTAQTEEEKVHSSLDVQKLSPIDVLRETLRWS